MLKVGNILNEGTKRGGAGGFTLDSLTKVVNTKGKRVVVVVLYCSSTGAVYSRSGSISM